MTELSLYQQSLGRSVEEIIKAQKSIFEFLMRIGELKVRALRDYIGKTYHIKGEELKAVAMMVLVSDSFWEHSILITHPIKIQIAFMKDLNPLLQSKKRYTDLERKYMEELKCVYQDARPEDYKYYTFNLNPHNRLDYIHDIGIKLINLKHKIDVVDIYTWGWSFDDLLASDFLETGIKINGVAF